METLHGGLGEISRILAAANSLGASDIFFTSGATPMARVDGQLRPVGTLPVSERLVRRWIQSALAPEDQLRLESLKTVDASYEPAAEYGRYRAHIALIEGKASVALRRIPEAVPGFADLGLPERLGKITELSRGLVLIVGSTSQGKSTTLSTILNQIVQSRPHHIVTIEDPIEFTFVNGGADGTGNSWVTQLEVGRDVPDFPSGFRGALRHNPDVIAIGEIRDRESFEVALQAAESGHLVLATLHATDAAEAIHRFVGFFQPGEQAQVRQRLSLALRMVVAQRLVRLDKSGGRVPAVEILIHNERVREILASPDRLHELVDVIEQSHQTFGMQSFDQSLMDLLTSRKINLATALAAATRPGLFEMWVRGVTSLNDEPRWASFQNNGSMRPLPAEELSLATSTLPDSMGDLGGGFTTRPGSRRRKRELRSLGDSTGLAAAAVAALLIAIVGLIVGGTPDEIPSKADRQVAMAEVIRDRPLNPKRSTLQAGKKGKSKSARRQRSK